MNSLQSQVGNPTRNDTRCNLTGVAINKEVPLKNTPFHIVLKPQETLDFTKLNLPATAELANII